MTDIDPTDIAAQEAARKDAQQRNKLAVVSEVEDIKWLMGNKRGRRIVHRLLANAGVFRLSFHTNALQMAFNEGNRNQGNALLALITEHCPERYAELQSEAKEK